MQNSAVQHNEKFLKTDNHETDEKLTEIVELLLLKILP